MLTTHRLNQGPIISIYVGARPDLHQAGKMSIALLVAFCPSLKKPIDDVGLVRRGPLLADVSSAGIVIFPSAQKATVAWVIQLINNGGIDKTASLDRLAPAEKLSLIKARARVLAVLGFQGRIFETLLEDLVRSFLNGYLTSQDLVWALETGINTGVHQLLVAVVTRVIIKHSPGPFDQKLLDFIPKLDATAIRREIYKLRGYIHGRQTVQRKVLTVDQIHFVYAFTAKGDTVRLDIAKHINALYKSHRLRNFYAYRAFALHNAHFTNDMGEELVPFAGQGRSNQERNYQGRNIQGRTNQAQHFQPAQGQPVAQQSIPSRPANGSAPRASGRRPYVPIRVNGNFRPPKPIGQSLPTQAKTQAKASAVQVPRNTRAPNPPQAQNTGRHSCGNQQRYHPATPRAQLIARLPPSQGKPNKTQPAKAAEQKLEQKQPPMIFGSLRITADQMVSQEPWKKT